MFPGGIENNQWYEIGVLNLTIFKYLQKQPPEVFYKKSCSENVAIFSGKHLRWSLFLTKLQAHACNFIKKRLQHRCFPVNIAKFLREPTLKNICERLLLYFTTVFLLWDQDQILFLTLFFISLLFLSKPVTKRNKGSRLKFCRRNRNLKVH